MFLVVVSILTSLFLLSSCESEEIDLDSINIDDSSLITTGDETSEPNKKIVNIRMSGNRFYPSVIEVDQGDLVLLRLTSPEAEGGFRLDAFGINTRIPTDLEIKEEFSADRKGEFTFTCGDYCPDVRIEESGRDCYSDSDCDELEECDFDEYDEEEDEDCQDPLITCADKGKCRLDDEEDLETRLLRGKIIIK